MARKPDQGIYWGLYLLLGSVGLGCLIMGIYALGMDNLKDYRITGLWGIGMIIGLFQVRHMQRWGQTEAYLKQIGPVLEHRFIGQPQIKKLCLKAADLVRQSTPKNGQQAFRKALEIVDGAIKKAWYDTDKGALLYLQGWFQDNMGQKKAAIDSLRASIKLDKANYSAWNMLGVLLVQQGNSALYDEAEQCYKAAIELGYIGRSESNLGMIYMRRGRLDYAKQWMELALQREEIPETLAALALLEAKLGSSAPAEHYYHRAEQAGYKNLDSLRQQIADTLSKQRRKTWTAGKADEAALAAANKDDMRTVR